MHALLWEIHGEKISVIIGEVIPRPMRADGSFRRCESRPPQALSAGGHEQPPESINQCLERGNDRSTRAEHGDAI